MNVVRARRGASAAAVAIAAIASFAPADARANGRYPTAGQAVVAPGDATHLYARTTFGVLVSRDAGATWDWICESAYGDTTNYDATIGVTANESILVASSNGLWVSPDGCAWSRVSSVGARVVTDLVVRADDPRGALAVTSDYAGTDAGVSTFASQVWSTSDDGATWSALGAPVDPPVLVATIEVARSDPARVYLTGFRTTGASTTGFLIASTDLAAHWSASSVPLAPSDQGAYLAAVDPNDAARVYVRTQGQSGGVTSGRLLVGDDAGASWQTAYAGGALLGFALSPDGGDVYVGGLWPNDGLLAARSDALAFTRRASLSIDCLATSGGALYACSDAFVSFPLGVSSDQGATFTPVLDFRAIRGPLACPAGSPTAACAAQWPALAAQLGIGGARDGGASDGGGDDASAPAGDDGGGGTGSGSGTGTGSGTAEDGGASSAPSRSSCACDEAQVRNPSPWSFPTAIALLLLVRRGRRATLRAR